MAGAEQSDSCLPQPPPLPPVSPSLPQPPPASPSLPGRRRQLCQFTLPITRLEVRELRSAHSLALSTVKKRPVSRYRQSSLACKAGLPGPRAQNTLREMRAQQLPLPQAAPHMERKQAQAENPQGHHVRQSTLMILCTFWHTKRQHPLLFFTCSQPPIFVGFTSTDPTKCRLKSPESSKK